MRLWHWCAFLLAAVCLATGLLPLHAAPPDALGPAPENWARSGGVVWQGTRVTDANTTTFPIHSTTASTAPACFGWHSQVVIRASVATRCCWTLTTSISMGSVAATVKHGQDLTVTTAGGNSDSGTAFGGVITGACIDLAANDRWSSFPRYESWFPKNAGARLAGGRRTGICSARQPLTLSVDDRRTPFCRVATGVDTNDCGEAGVGATATCSAIDTDAEVQTAATNGCAFLVCRSAVAGYVTVSVER